MLLCAVLLLLAMELLVPRALAVEQLKVTVTDLFFVEFDTGLMVDILKSK